MPPIVGLYEIVLLCPPLMTDVRIPFALVAFGRFEGSGLMPLASTPPLGDKCDKWTVGYFCTDVIADGFKSVEMVKGRTMQHHFVEMGFSDIFVTISVDKPQEGLLQLELATNAPWRYGGIFVNFFVVRKKETVIRMLRGDIKPGTRLVFSFYEAVLPEREVRVKVDVPDVLFRFEWGIGPITMMCWAAGIAGVIGCVSLVQFIMSKTARSDVSTESMGVELFRGLRLDSHRKRR
jgi:hypothetical protein